MTSVDPKRRSAIVSYSHTEAGWSSDQTEHRLQLVHRLVFALRIDGGIVADADIFHQNEDWTRWGPRQVEDSDFVLIIASPAWRDAWSGAGDPLRNKGVRAEADVVRSLEAKGRELFQRRVRLIMLPGSTDEHIPMGMHGLARHRLNGFKPADLEPLLRDLTDQPRFAKPPVGEVPAFPPAMTTHTSDVAQLETAAEDALHVPGLSEIERTARIRQLEEQLDALPRPLPGEGPHLPLFRIRAQIEARRSSELHELSGGNDVSNARVSQALWTPVLGVDATWAEQWRPGITYTASAVVLHVFPIPQVPVSQRVLSSLDDILTDLLHKASLLELGQGFTKAFPGDDVVIEVDPFRVGYGDVDLGRFLGCRAGRSGQVSVWFSLATDGMGAVLDEDRLTGDLQKALELGGQVLGVTHGDRLGRIAVAAELVQLKTLTGGTLDQLGRRSHASLPSAFRREPPRMKPDESVAPSSVQSPISQTIAAEVARVLIRSWRG